MSEPRLSLISVNAENWRQVAALQVSPDQREFVAEPTYYAYATTAGSGSRWQSRQGMMPMAAAGWAGSISIHTSRVKDTSGRRFRRQSSSFPANMDTTTLRSPTSQAIPARDSFTSHWVLSRLVRLRVRRSLPGCIYPPGGKTIYPRTTSRRISI